MYTFFSSSVFYLFFFNDPAPTEIYTLSLHDALPISHLFRIQRDDTCKRLAGRKQILGLTLVDEDRKSTRLNSSHITISYAVFCLKKKKNHNIFFLSKPYFRLHCYQIILHTNVLY